MYAYTNINEINNKLIGVLYNRFIGTYYTQTVCIRP